MRTGSLTSLQLVSDIGARPESHKGQSNPGLKKWEGSRGKEGGAREPWDPGSEELQAGGRAKVHPLFSNLQKLHSPYSLYAPAMAFSPQGISLYDLSGLYVLSQPAIRIYYEF